MEVVRAVLGVIVFNQRDGPINTEVVGLSRLHGSRPSEPEAFEALFQDPPLLRAEEAADEKSFDLGDTSRYLRRVRQPPRANHTAFACGQIQAGARHRAEHGDAVVARWSCAMSAPLGR